MICVLIICKFYCKLVYLYCKLDGFVNMFLKARCMCHLKLSLWQKEFLQ